MSRHPIAVVSALLLSAVDVAAQEHSHDSHAGHSEMDHSAVMSMPAAKAPSLRTSAILTGAGQVEVELETARFEFSREHADQAHVPGEGHAHIYLDGEKLAECEMESPPVFDGMIAAGERAFVTTVDGSVSCWE